MTRAGVLWAICRGAPYVLLLGLAGVLLCGVPIPPALLAVLLVACLALLVGLAWFAERKERPRSE